jgi:hypothetical protein
LDARAIVMKIPLQRAPTPSVHGDVAGECARVTVIAEERVDSALATCHGVGNRVEVVVPQRERIHQRHAGGERVALEIDDGRRPRGRSGIDPPQRERRHGDVEAERGTL